MQLRLSRGIAEVAALLLLALAGIAEGQVLRGPDLGVWFREEREARGGNGLVVDGLLENGSMAHAGLLEGDRIVSVDGRVVESEAQFVRGVMRSSDGDHLVRVVVDRRGVSGEAKQQTISLQTRDVWKAVVAADPFYQAGFLVNDGNNDEDRDERDRAHGEGVVVRRVFPLTPAFYAGLRQGDAITSVSGQSVLSAADVAQYFRIGGRLTLGVMRGEESRQLHILLPSRRPLEATLDESRGVQPPASFVPHVVPMAAPPPLIVPPEVRGPLSPIPSALPPNRLSPLPN